MTDRLHSLTVVLSENLRTDDAAPLIAAISQLKGVLSVTGIVADFSDHMAVERARHDLGTKLWSVLYGDKK